MVTKIKAFIFALSSMLSVVNIYGQEQSVEIPLVYDVSGYAENNSQNQLADKTAVDPLAPIVNGEMSVNESGALTYILQLEVLKGLNNFHPNIALAYNSQSGNGLAGWGWNVVGVSAITQGGKSKEIDGLTIGPQFNGTDPFYLDGQRLLKISDSEYVTEKFSKIKISKLSSGEYSFIIRYTDGKIAKFKELISGQHYLSVMIDPYDNEIHYSYQNDQNTIFLTKISYGGASVATDKFYIDFTYKNRIYPVKMYRNNVMYVNNRIISEINSGSTYDQTYRNYTLTHDYIENGTTERLREVKVKLKNGELLKPLSFKYNSASQGSIKINSVSNNGIGSETTGLGSVAVGNFTGKGDIEAVYQTRSANNKYDLKTSSGSYLPNTNYNSSTEFYSGKILGGNNNLRDNDQLITVKVNYLDTPNLQDITASINYNLRDEVNFITKDLINGREITVTYILQGGLTSRQNMHAGNYDDDGNYNPSYVYYRDSKRDFQSGDFNNDGLVDFLIIEAGNEIRSGGIYLAEVGKAALNGGLQPTPVKLSSTIGVSDNVEIYPIEFDGDGIPELMAVTKYNGKYSIYKINFANQSLDNIYNTQTLLNFGYDTPIFFGDFNGDGLTDFITPQKVYKIEEGDDDNGYKLGNTYFSIENEPLLWRKYISTGKSYQMTEENYTSQKIFYIKPSQNNVIKHTTFWQKFWNGQPDSYAYTRYSTHNIIITDYDGDGRSDIITLNKIGNAKYSPSGKLTDTTVDNISNQLTRRVNAGFPISVTFTSSLTNKVNFYLNTDTSGGNFIRQESVSIVDTKISPLSLILGSTDFNRLNIYQSGFFIHDPIVKRNTKIFVDNNNFLEKQIQEVDNNSSVIQKVQYRNMVNNNLPDEKAYIYDAQSGLQYPYYTHSYNGNMYLVNKIHTEFVQTIDNIPGTKILTKEYRYENAVQNLEGKGFLGFSKTYVSDSYQSEFLNGKYRIKDPFKAVFWNIQTKNPLLDNAVVKTTYGGLKKFISENEHINKKYDKGNHRYIILLTDEVAKDNLKKITINKKYIYDELDDLKLKTTYTDYDNIGSKVSNYTYKPEFFNGDHYFYGKILTDESTVFKDGLSFGGKEVNDYNDRGNLSENKKYSNDANAPPIVATYTYDLVGNMETQTLSAAGIVPQTTRYEYDLTKRYVKKTTTPEGLSSHTTVDFQGRISDETTTLGLTSFYAYDKWGNIEEVTDYLGKKTTTTKTIAAGPIASYNISKKREGGIETITTFDKFDREIQTKIQSVNGKWIVEKKEYDIFGRKTKYTESFFENEAEKWNGVKYDELGRPVENKSFNNKIVKTCYEGLKVTVDDGHKKTSKTLDAMGNTIRYQDQGGVIGYSYYPNGALKQTNYEGVKINFEIDNWGNKSKVIDPSAGEFTYQYDNLNRLEREDNPKGYTLYTYDDLGRPETEKTYGKTTSDNTTIEKTYKYDDTSTGKFLPNEVIATNNGQTFKYITLYDQYYRVRGKIEQTPEFTYSSSTTFDSFGRADVVDINVTLQSPSLGSSSSVKNIYDSNGLLIQQNDNISGTMIWHISDVNELGQTKQMEYGNGYVLKTEYAPNGSLTDIRHKHNITNEYVVDIGFVYDIDKGILKSRNNRLLGKDEVYTYDDLNRLLTERLNNTLINEYTYDNRGRLTSNSNLGKYNYETGNYKLKNIDLNTNGQNVNSQRGFATVSYNAFKSPLNIQLQGRENLTYSYNPFKTRYKSVSSVNGITKLYSSDFAVEIILRGNRTEIITYVTGDPYSANYIKKTVKTKNLQPVNSNYYLHRDNLGSIIAITDATTGAAIEKRYYDAWGNIKMLVDIDQNTITDSQELADHTYFIDRGYTGHEHLWKVGLINMNARIYDPVLRRFLSPDNFVKNTLDTQSYDRYSYVYNNPLLYIDPSGNLAFLAFVAIGVAVAVVTKSIANMINGIPFWYGLGKAAVTGAVTAAISYGIGYATSTIGGFSPAAMSTQEALLSGLGQVIGAFLPSWELNLGDWTLSVGFSLALGKGNSFGLNVGLSYSSGDFEMNFGFGISYFGNHAGSGSRGFEYRKSVMLGTKGTEGNLGIMLGTNFWSGIDGKQQTGVIRFQSGDFSMSYENDGSPFGKLGLGNNNDTHRTAAMTLSIGDFNAGFNLYTGERSKSTYEEGNDENPGYNKYGAGVTADAKMMQWIKSNGNTGITGMYGENYRWGVVQETGLRHRLGAAYVGWGNMRVGFDSEWIRHGIQNVFAHTWLSPQPQFVMLSDTWNWYLQYKTINKFTSW